MTISPAQIRSYLTSDVDGCRRSFWVMVWFVIASGCGSQSSHLEEQDAIAKIQALKGTVEFEKDAVPPRIVKVDLHSTAVTDEDLTSLEACAKLQNLYLGRTAITDAGLATVGKIQGLRTLALNATLVTDAGLRNLGTLKNLKTLNLQDTKVTPAGLADLRQLLPETAIAR